MLLIALALAATEPPVRPMTAEIVRDAITDRIGASATISDGRNRLVVDCEPDDPDRVRVTVHASRWLARGNIFTGARPLIYRFDAESPRRMLWEIDDRAATLDSPSRLVPFLHALMAAERLVIRARDVELNEFDIVFRLQGVRPALEQVLTACADTRLSGQVLGAP